MTGTVTVLNDHQRALKAITLKEDGKTYEQIATELGYTDRSAAHGAVKRALARGVDRATDEQRSVENGRLDRLWAVWFPLALQGDLFASREARAISQQRVALWGLNVNEARMAGAMEVSAMAEVAAVSMWHAALLQAMTAAGVEPDQQQRVVEELNRRVQVVEGETA